MVKRRPLRERSMGPNQPDLARCGAGAPEPVNRLSSDRNFWNEFIIILIIIIIH